MTAASRTVEPRVLFHCVNGNGMGHFLRAVALAGRLRQLISGLQPLILTSCEDPGFAWREGITSIKVPSRQATGWALSAQQVGMVARQVTAMTFAAFNPNIFISDTLSSGEYLELLPYLYDRRLKICIMGTMNLYDPRFNGSLGLYSRLLISAPEILRGRTTLSAPADVPWVAPVLPRNADQCLTRAEARRHLRLPQDERVVLVTLGGGGSPDGMERLRTVIDTAALFPDVVFAISEPPLALFRIRAIGEGNVVSFAHTPLQEVLAAFDAALSAAGVSALGEHLSAGLPSVWLPSGEPSPDQVIHAGVLAELGLGIVLDRPDGLALRAAIERVLDRAEAAAIRRRMLPHAGNGADQAAALVATWWHEYLVEQAAASA